MDTLAWYILFFASLYSTYKFTQYYLDKRDYFLLFTTLSLFFLSIYSAAMLFGPMISSFDFGIVAEWGKVLSSACILTGLGFLIRNSKPLFARFPVGFALIPLTIIPAYILVLNTLLLKEIVIAMLLGGSILIGLLVFILKTGKHPDFWFVVLGIFLLLASFVLFWLNDSIVPFNNVISIYLLAAGILLISKVYSNVYLVPEYEYENTSEFG